MAISGGGDATIRHSSISIAGTLNAHLLLIFAGTCELIISVS